MVDVTGEVITTRTALAEATVRTREDVIAMILTFATCPRATLFPLHVLPASWALKRTRKSFPSTAAPGQDHGGL